MYTACARMPNKPYVDEDEDEGERGRGDKNTIHAGRGSHTTSTCPIASRGYQTQRTIATRLHGDEEIRYIRETRRERQDEGRRGRRRPGRAREWVR